MRRLNCSQAFWATAISLALFSGFVRAELRCGVAKVDVTPNQLPVLVNGSMTSHTADRVKTRVNARAIVLDDGRERLAIMVVDSCMMPRDLLDEVKQLASTRTQLRPDRILISATHTHTAPSSMGALGTDPDPQYVPLLRQRLVEALEAAEAQLTPARVGWGVGAAPQFTALRRWVRRPDRIANDPFGNPTVRANMHSARNPDDATGPSGPEDPALSMIAFQTLDGQPLATLANFSMHYFGDQPISADYFGLFCDGLEQFMQNASGDAAIQPLALMSHGCSGDIWKRDYMQAAPEAEGTIGEYAQGLLNIATGIYESIEFTSDADLAMSERRLDMKYRVPDAQRLEWAQRIVQELGERLPQTQPEIYAREQVYLHERQSTEIVLQALRIGDIAIATTPTETYALTGLKLKHQSPLAKTMVIELANGGDGYVPPPEQHYLGGYNTWAARSAGLEETAEPKMVAADLQLLEQVCGQPRRLFRQSSGGRAAKILDLQPLAYWRLDEMSGNVANDARGQGPQAIYEPGVVYWLEGPDGFTDTDDLNRCPHFAGGRLRAHLPQIRGDFSLLLHFWNGMPVDGREVAGWMFSRDYEWATSESGVHLGLAGTGAADRAGRLLLQIGSAAPSFGKQAIARWQWNSLGFVKSGRKIQVYLGHDSAQPEIQIELSQAQADGLNMADLFFGGRSDNASNWEGRLDEIAIFNKALSTQQVQSLVRNP